MRVTRARYGALLIVVLIIIIIIIIELFYICDTRSIVAVAADGGAGVNALFRCSASLSIPLMAVLPTPDEIQAAVVQAVKLIQASLKSVTQWSITFSDGDDADQRTTTSGNNTGD